MMIVPCPGQTAVLTGTGSAFSPADSYSPSLEMVYKQAAGYCQGIFAGTITNSKGCLFDNTTGDDDQADAAAKAIFLTTMKRLCYKLNQLWLNENMGDGVHQESASEADNS